MMWESFWNTTWEILGPVYATLLPIAASAAVGWAVQRYKKVTGVQMDKVYSDLIQGTITRTANAIVVKAGGVAALNSLPAEALEFGVKLVRDAVPDAVAHFEKQGLTDAKIAEKILPQAEAIIAAAPLTPEAAAGHAPLKQMLGQALKPVPDPELVPNERVIDQIVRGMAAAGKR
jgi:hypothetical protein